MSAAYSAADVVISRAGALSISELTYMGKAMILIPFPYAAENHQEINANYIQNKNACIVINQNQLDTGILEKTIAEIILNKNKIKSLQQMAKKIAVPNSNDKIIEQIKMILK